MNQSMQIQKELERHFPDLEAVYFFGSRGTPQERPDSDADIAVLLPWNTAKKAGQLVTSDCRKSLEEIIRKPVDLINLRQVSTVLQKEVISLGERVLCRNPYAADEFEMLTLSFYQKLNEERKEIVEEFLKSKRAYPV